MAELELGIDASEARKGEKEFTNSARRAARSGEKLEQQNKELDSSFSKVGKTAKIASGLVAAFAGAAIVRQTFALAEASIQTAAAYETLEVSLEVLTGTAEGAADAMARIRDLAVETPFSVQELTTAASSMAVVFRSNTEAIAEFTQITANLAAGFNRDVVQIGQNVQRAFSGGLASAEVLRESGITQRLLEVSGAMEASELTGDRLTEAFRLLAGESGVLGDAALRMSLTLGGSLSNIGVAADNMRNALGTALSPTVIAVANEVIIPSLQNMQEVVEGNSESITLLATQAMASLIDGFAGVLDSIAALEERMAVVGAGFGSIVDGLVLISASGNLALEGLSLTINLIGDRLTRLAEIAVLVGEKFGFISAEDSASLRTYLQDLVDLEDNEDAIKKFGDQASAAIAGLSANFEESKDGVTGYSEALRASAEALRERGDNMEAAVEVSLKAIATNEELAASVDKVSAATEKASVESKRFSKTFEIMDKEADATAASFERIGDSVASAFGRAATSTDDLNTRMLNLLQTLLELAFQQAVIGPLGGIISGVLGGIVSGFGGGIASPATPLSGVDPGLTLGQDLFIAQHGTDFTVGGGGGHDSQFVPLRVSPGERVQVTPHGQSSGGGDVRIEVFPSSGISIRTERESFETIERIRVFAAQASVDEVNRGDGSIRRAISNSFHISSVGETT